MSKNEDVEVFTAEFRHDAVSKFLTDLISGRIRLALPPDVNSELGNSIANTYATLTRNIVNYVSGKEQDKQNELEEKIFSDIVLMRISGTVLINDNSSNDKFIENINKKIDSTNLLLQTVLKVSLELSKKA